VALAIEANSELRTITVSATPALWDRISRLEALGTFIAEHASADARLSYLQGDASARRYGVLRTGDMRHVLMDSPQRPDGPVVEDGKPYSAIAHLAESVLPFAAVGTALRDAGVRVPEILETDLAQGFLLIEHLGDRVFGEEIANGEEIEPLYRSACDVLSHLRGQRVPERIALADGSTHHVPRFDWPTFRIEAALFTDWYFPAVSGTRAAEEVTSAFESAWCELHACIDGGDHWILRDFHSPNLIQRPEAEGLDRVGVIDFQDALRGHPAYDLVSLLQDARLSVPEEVEVSLLDRYCAMTGADFDELEFRRAYAILGAQRNTKILGIFARLAQRDGKPQYLSHVPRIWGYLERNLRHDALDDVRCWYNVHVPESWRRLG